MPASVIGDSEQIQGSTRLMCPRYQSDWLPTVGYHRIRGHTGHYSCPSCPNTSRLAIWPPSPPPTPPAVQAMSGPSDDPGPVPADAARHASTASHSPTRSLTKLGELTWPSRPQPLVRSDPPLAQRDTAHVSFYDRETSSAVGRHSSSLGMIAFSHFPQQTFRKHRRHAGRHLALMLEVLVNGGLGEPHPTITALAPGLCNYARRNTWSGATDCTFPHRHGARHACLFLRARPTGSFLPARSEAAMPQHGRAAPPIALRAPGGRCVPVQVQASDRAKMPRGTVGAPERADLVYSAGPSHMTPEKQVSGRVLRAICDLIANFETRFREIEGAMVPRVRIASRTPSPVQELHALRW